MKAVRIAGNGPAVVSNDGLYIDFPTDQMHRRANACDYFFLFIVVTNLFITKYFVFFWLGYIELTSTLRPIIDTFFHKVCIAVIISAYCDQQITFQ